MKIIAIFFYFLLPLLGSAEDHYDYILSFPPGSSPWVEKWNKEWNGDPWLMSVEGENQSLLHYKSVKDWADNRPFFDHPFDRARNAEELFGPLIKQLPLQPGTYAPPFKRTPHQHLKVEDAFVFLTTQARLGGDPKPFWIVMDEEGHVLFTFRWCYSSRYEFPLVFATASVETMLRFNYPYPASRRLYPNFKDEDFPPPFKQPVSLVQRAKDRVLYALDPKTRLPIRLYVYNKGSCAVFVNGTASFTALDWDSPHWNQYERQTPEEMKRLERILGQFIDIQMNPSSTPPDCRQDIQQLLLKGRERGRLFHQERDKEQKKLFQIASKCNSLIQGIFPTFEPDYISPLSPFRDEDRREFLRELNLPLNRFYPNAWVDVTCQVSYCTERWIKKIWKGDLKVDEPNKCQKRSFLCTLMPESRGRTVSIAYAISEYASENLCREALADRRFWRPFNEPKESLQDTLRHTRINPGLVGEYDLTSTLRMNYRGVIIPESDTSSIIFRRGNTVVALIASDPNYSVLPLAKKIDQALKNIYEPEP